MLPLLCCAFGGSCNRYALIPATQPKGFSPAAISVSRDPSFFFLPPPLARRQAPRSPPGLPAFRFSLLPLCPLSFNYSFPFPFVQAFPAFRFLFASLSLPNFPFCYLLFTSTAVSFRVSCYRPSRSNRLDLPRRIEIESMPPRERRWNRTKRKGLKERGKEAESEVWCGAGR